MTALVSPFAGPLDPGQAAALAVVVKALANPVRLRLLSLIHRYGADGACPADLRPHVGIKQPTVSKHLSLLADAGLVTVTKEGVWSVHHVDYDRLAAVAGLLQPGRRKP